MFLLYRTIYVSPSYLELTSDPVLSSAIMHEIGHTKRRLFTITITMVTISLCTMVFYLLPLICVFVVYPTIYILFCLYLRRGVLFCLYLRRGEYYADGYALKHTSYNGVVEMLELEGARLDCKFIDNSLLYLFRFHPCYKKRIKNIETHKLHQYPYKY